MFGPAGSAGGPDKRPAVGLKRELGAFARLTLPSTGDPRSGRKMRETHINDAIRRSFGTQAMLSYLEVTPFRSFADELGPR